MSLSIRSTVVSIPPAEFPAFIETIRTQITLQTLLATIVIYDAACTLDKEVKYLWQSGLNATKIAFYVNRLAGIFGTMTFIIGYLPDPSDNRCRLAAWGPSLSYCAIIAAIDYILMIRVLSLYHHEKRTTILLTVLLVLEVIGRIIFAVIEVHQEGLGIASLPTRHTACTMTGEVDAHIIYISWIIPLAYSSLLMLLALYKSSCLWREKGFRGSRLLRMLIKDQLLYYVLTSFCSIFNLFNVKYSLMRVPSAVFEALGSPIFLCVLGSRITFNLREAADHGINRGTNWSSYTHSTIQFAGPVPQGETTSTLVGTEATVIHV